MSSIKDIAKLAQVSPGTASLVLNGKGTALRISTATQQRILEAARALDYSPNISARRLRSGGETVAPIIALFWTIDTRASLIGRYLKGVQDIIYAQETEYELLIQPYVGGRLKDVKSLVTGTRFNGAIIANATAADEAYLQSAPVKVPAVLYQRYSDKFGTINVDNYHTGQEVARLFASRGHSLTGLVIPKVSSRAIHDRKKGFLDQASAVGLPVAAAHIAEGEFSEEGGYQATRVLLQAEVKPSALFVLSDQMAVGALAALREAGLRVPEDIELVGHDDNEIARFTVPPLTTIHFPVEEMAQACIKLLIDVMHHQVATPTSTMFKPHFVFRQSCGDFKK
ncbi:LacI family DNA-binding transcriptional regulator [Paenibacillus agricola]|uniref:LacI family transcriptional regulator n=1 Tax=Paenibacillus agricola TaxID=2716264 RepID=A0ABX0JCH6_9BACL|nr:LacI family DNA-binding transcriptional regulator [Paenibacillus agricola]NHN31380.1 LacI family transcriptional regulator [Paenibacillus agricola]